MFALHSGVARNSQWGGIGEGLGAEPLGVWQRSPALGNFCNLKWKQGTFIIFRPK